MKKLFAAVACAAATLFAGVASASTCPNHPYTLTNGQSADATQVMADFNNLLNCLNLNVAPIANPVFTGTVTIPTLSVTGTSALAGSLTVTNGTAASGGNYFIASPSDTGSGKPQFIIQKQAGNTQIWNIQSYDGASGGGTLNLQWATVNLSGGMTVGTSAVVSGGLTVNNSETIYNGLFVQSGSVTVPAGSIVNADLDTVNSPGSCGSATSTCTLTANAQGRITAQGSAAIQPDTCSINNTSGYCRNPNGYVRQWYHYDSGTFNGWGGGPTTITFPYSPAHGCYSYEAISDNQGSVSSPYYALQITSAPGGNSVTVQAAGFQSGSRNAIEGFYVTADCY